MAADTSCGPTAIEGLLLHVAELEARIALLEETLRLSQCIAAAGLRGLDPEVSRDAWHVYPEPNPLNAEDPPEGAFPGAARREVQA